MKCEDIVRRERARVEDIEIKNKTVDGASEQEDSTPTMRYEARLHVKRRRTA